MNLLIFGGRVGGDATIKHLDNGTKIISFSVCHSEKYTSNGQQVEKSIWLRCSWFKSSDQSTKVADYIKKGSYVTVTGNASASAFAGKDGSPAASLECRVINLELGGSSSDVNSSPQPASVSSVAAPGVMPEVGDGDLPF